MAEGKNRWWAVLDLVMNIGVPLNVGNFLTSSASQEGLCSVEFVKALCFIFTGGRVSRCSCE